MSSQARIGGESALEIDGAVALERSEVGAGHRFLQKIERDLFMPMRCHRKAAAVYGNAVARVDLAGNARSGQLQLRSAIGRSNPEHVPNFLDQTGKHWSVIVRRHPLGCK